MFRNTVLRGVDVRMYHDVPADDIPRHDGVLRDPRANRHKKPVVVVQRACRVQYSTVRPEEPAARLNDHLNIRVPENAHGDNKNKEITAATQLI